MNAPARPPSLLGRIYLALLDDDRENRQMRKVLARLGAGDPATRILDVGCGYGRVLRLIRALGGRATGVEANPALRLAVQAEGFACQSVEEWRAGAGEFDVIIMAHVIEHFAPNELLVMMEGYLDRLRPGGHLVIATPLLSPYFFLDFDHVKPYLPTGILMVFGGGPAQVQYYARNRLELTDLWYRRTPYHVLWGALAPVGARWWHRWANLLGALAYHATFGLLGRTDGWVGVFRKLPSAPVPVPGPPGGP